MAKSLDEINAEFSLKHGLSTEGSPRKPDRKKQAAKIISEILFYSVLLLIILAALFIRTTDGGAPRTLAGYSAMIVLTESMQDVIPKGSLVVTKSVDPADIQVGDDITYMANRTTSVSHRVIGIIEQYHDTGERAFETQGVMNAMPDSLVPAANVVGKVIYHSQTLGAVASFIKTYWPVLAFVLAVGAILSYVLRRIMKKP